MRYTFSDFAWDVRNFFLGALIGLGVALAYWILCEIIGVTVVSIQNRAFTWVWFLAGRYGNGIITTSFKEFLRFFAPFMIGAPVLFGFILLIIER